VITYCTNIHPGEGWQETERNLATHLLAVKRAVSPDRPFPIGLWLSHRASQEIDAGAAEAFGRWCLENGCFVPTINGFPYGLFHGASVKEKVYLPDWRSRERAAYTMRLADLLDQWLPEGVLGSISTVPVGFRSRIGPADHGAIRQNLLDVVEHLDGLKQAGGREIVLALEPEPGCLLETTAEAVRFIERLALPGHLRESLGLCFDCCHQAVEFEEPAESLGLLRQAGIRLGKVQVSSALRVQNGDPRVLARFCEPTYLHQTVVRQPDGTLCRYGDLPEAMQRHRAGEGQEWRVHFHVPVFLDRTRDAGTTRFFLEQFLPLIDETVLLEVETYTWDVLPPELRAKSVAESIGREIQWVEGVRR
jgi:sugar phosphate isomerase/epimerase